MCVADQDIRQNVISLTMLTTSNFSRNGRKERKGRDEGGSTETYSFIHSIQHSIGSPIRTCSTNMLFSGLSNKWKVCRLKVSQKNLETSITSLLTSHAKLLEKLETLHAIFGSTDATKKPKTLKSSMRAFESSIETCESAVQAFGSSLQHFRSSLHALESATQTLDLFKPLLNSSKQLSDLSQETLKNAKHNLDACKRELSILRSCPCNCIVISSTTYNIDTASGKQHGATLIGNEKSTCSTLDTFCGVPVTVTTSCTLPVHAGTYCSGGPPHAPVQVDFNVSVHK